MASKRRTFVGDVAKLASGNVAARALGYALYLVVLSQYGARDFGQVAVFVSFVTIPGSLACLCYPYAIILPKRDEDAANLFGVSVMLALAAALATSAVVAPNGEAISRWLRVPALAEYLWLAPVTVLLIGWNQALSYWVTRRKRFGLMGVSHVVAVAAIRGVQVGAAWLSFSHVGGLVTAYLLGRAATFLVLGTCVWLSDRRVLLGSLNWRTMLAEMKRYRKFPLVSSWGLLINGLAAGVPALMLNRFFSNAVAGYFHVATKLLSQPVTLLSNAVAKVFYQRASDLHARGESLAKLVEEVYRRLTAFAVLPVCVLALTAHEVAAVLPGDYAVSGPYLAIFCPMLWATFVATPFAQMFFVFERQEITLLVQVISLGIGAGALALGGHVGSPLIAVSLFSLGNVAVYVGVLLVAFRLAGVPWRRSVDEIRHYLAYLVPALAIFVPLRLWGGLPPWAMVGLGAGAISAYVGVIIWRDKVLVRFLR